MLHPVLVLVAIVLIAAAAGGVYYFGRDRIFDTRHAGPVAILVTPTPTPQQVETANWKDYRGNGITFKYPVEYTFDEKDVVVRSGRTTLTFKHKDYNPHKDDSPNSLRRFDINILEASELSLEEYVQRSYGLLREFRLGAFDKPLETERGTDGPLIMSISEKTLGSNKFIIIRDYALFSKIRVGL